MPGADAVLARLHLVQAHIREGLAKGLEEAMKQVAEHARQEHRFTSRSGHLEESIEGGLIEGDRDTLRGAVTAGGGAAPYAPYLELRGVVSQVDALGRPIDLSEEDLLARAAREGNWTFLSTALLAHQDELLETIAAPARL